MPVCTETLHLTYDHKVTTIIQFNPATVLHFKGAKCKSNLDALSLRRSRTYVNLHLVAQRCWHILSRIGLSEELSILPFLHENRDISSTISMSELERKGAKE